MYEKRAVLFIDILGFKNLIKENREDLILNALEIPKGLKDRYPFNEKTKMQISAFSDSIVVSEVIEYDHIGMIRLAGYANYLWWKFLAKGVLTRGGISVGNLYHKDGIIFGPAMNEAYELESQIANYPRIVVSEVAKQRHHEEVEIEHKEYPHRVTFEKIIFRKDFDGITHINVLAPTGPTPTDIKPKKDVDPITGGLYYTTQELNEAKWLAVEKLLENRPSERRAASKHDWLNNYLSAAKKDYS